MLTKRGQRKRCMDTGTYSHSLFESGTQLTLFFRAPHSKTFGGLQ
jgi:hypothetical protein